MLYCDSYYDVQVTGQPEPSAYRGILTFFDDLRASTKATIATIIPDTLVRGFVLAMVLGEKRALPEEVWEDFRQAGLSHILVVSGFNLGIIAWVFYIILRLLRLAQREVRIVLVMLGTLFYGALIGPQPSVIRAVIVVEFILLSRLIERRADLTNVTAGASLLNLSRREPGFLPKANPQATLLPSLGVKGPPAKSLVPFVCRTEPATQRPRCNGARSPQWTFSSPCLQTDASELCNRH